MEAARPGPIGPRGDRGPRSRSPRQVDSTTWPSALMSSMNAMISGCGSQSLSRRKSLVPGESQRPPAAGDFRVAHFRHNSYSVRYSLRTACHPVHVLLAVAGVFDPTPGADAQPGNVMRTWQKSPDCMLPGLSREHGGLSGTAFSSSTSRLTDTASCESLRLQLVELGLGDRSRVEELFGRRDLIGARAAAARGDD